MIMKNYDAFRFFHADFDNVFFYSNKKSLTRRLLYFILGSAIVLVAAVAAAVVVPIFFSRDHARRCACFEPLPTRRLRAN